MAQFDPGRTINGTFGRLYRDGILMASVSESAGTISVQTEDVQPNGQLAIGTKQTGETIEVTFTQFRITDDLVRDYLQARSNNERLHMDFISRLEDPESYGVERVRYVDCVPIGDVPVHSWTNQELVNEEWTLRAMDVIMLDPIEA